MQNASADPTAIRLAEIVGMLAAGQDNAFGQPVASQLRSDPRQLLPEILRNAGGGSTAAQRFRSVVAMLAGGRRYVEMNFRTGCEVGDALLEWLGFPAAVREALQHTFEQWNGKGFPMARAALRSHPDAARQVGS